MEKGVVKTTWRWLWLIFKYGGFPVFIFKQLVSIVALWDSSKTIIAMDEEERASKSEKQE